MTQRLSRTDMRRDELVEGLNKGFEFTHDHLRQILVALGVVGAVGLAWLGFRSWKTGQEDAANAALAAAQEVYTAPLRGEEAPAAADPTRPTFASAEERRQRAEQLFTELRREHGGPAADAAAVYLAEIALAKGDQAAAEALWREVADHQPDSMVGSAARLALVRLERSRGRSEEALKTLEAMLADERREIPDDVLLYEIAATLRHLGRPAEARGHLQRILDEFPRSSYRSAAQQEIASLPPLPAAS